MHLLIKYFLTAFRLQMSDHSLEAVRLEDISVDDDLATDDVVSHLKVVQTMLLDLAHHWDLFDHRIFEMM